MIKDMEIDINKEAAEKLQRLLDLPLPKDCDDFSQETFDPWIMFPSLYGTYCDSFDTCAIEVLTELKNGIHERDDLGSDMFREILCNVNLCEYGTSPRNCFPTSYFLPILPIFIEKWKAYSIIKWEVNILEEK